ARHPHNTLDQLLAHAVFRMGLAGEDDLNRPISGLDQIGQALDVLKDQAGSLVGSESPGETDRQGIQIKSVHGLLNRSIAFISTASLSNHAIPNEVDQPGFENLLGLPKLGINDGFDTLPRFRVTLSFGPVDSQMPIEEKGHLRSRPGLYVDAVGDVPDWHVLF